MKLKRKSGTFLVVDKETNTFAVKPLAQSRYSRDDIEEAPKEDPHLTEPEKVGKATEESEEAKVAETSSIQEETIANGDIPKKSSIQEEIIYEQFPDSHQQTQGDLQDLNMLSVPSSQIPIKQDHVIFDTDETSQKSWSNSNGTNHIHASVVPTFTIPRISPNNSGTSPRSNFKGFHISERPRWRSWLLFQLCSLGVLFSLGTTWRFPSLAYENYGGTFVFAYLIAWLLICLPVLILEQLVGQFAHKGPWKIWACVPLFRGIAITQCIISAYLIAMFNILVAWFGVYFSSSFTEPLSWNSSVAINGSEYRNVSDAEHYFTSNILKMTDLDEISSMDYRTIVAILIASVIIIAICVYDLRIFELAIPILATLILVLTIALLTYACLRDGAKDGIVYFFTPQWHHLLDSKVWYSAVTQVIYSHSIGLGVHITLAGINRFEWPVARCAMITSITSMLFTLFFGLTTYALLGNMAFSIQMEIENAVDLGYGLIFIVVSDSVSTMALSPQGFSAAIFAVFFVCGTMSPAVLVVNIITVIRGQFKKLFTKDWIAVISVVILGFLVSLVFTTQGGLYFLKIFDAYGVSVPAMVCLGMETIGFLWIYAIKLFQRDFNMMTASPIKWVAVAAYITPILILVVSTAALVQFDLVLLDGRSMPTWAHGLGAALLVIAVLPIFVYMVYVILIQLDYGILGKLQLAASATVSWGPNEFRHRQTWLGHKVESYSNSDTRALDEVSDVSSRDEYFMKRDDGEEKPDAWAMY